MMYRIDMIILDKIFRLYKEKENELEIKLSLGDNFFLYKYYFFIIIFTTGDDYEQ